MYDATAFHDICTTSQGCNACDLTDACQSWDYLVNAVLYGSGGR